MYETYLDFYVRLIYNFVCKQKPDPEHLLSQYEQVLSEQLSSEMESVRHQVQDVKSQLALAEQVSLFVNSYPYQPEIGTHLLFKNKCSK